MNETVVGWLLQPGVRIVCACCAADREHAEGLIPGVLEAVPITEDALQRSGPSECGQCGRELGECDEA